MNETTSDPVFIEMRDAQIAALRDTSLIVLEKVNWSVRRGEFWVVAGPPYSGKSDLLMHAAGLMPPVSGSCKIFGVPAGEFDETKIAERQRIGFVLGDGKLFNHLTIAGNIALPLRYHKDLPAAEIERTVGTLLELMELTPFAGLMPVNVAANWRQRAALARALALRPELLLLDNPNGGLAARHRRWLVNFLDQLWRGHAFLGGRPMTIVATTDDLRAWEHPQRKFAAVHAGNFSELGAWDAEKFGRHEAVKELLATGGERDA